MNIILDAAKKVLPRPIKEVIKKGIYRLKNRPFKPYLVKKNIEGVVFDFWIGDRDGRDWYDLESKDPDWIEMRFVKDNLIRPGDVVLECGGHHGCTAILLSNWVGPEGKVVSFEALPGNCDIIERNIQQNGLQNVTLERKAVGAERGKITIHNTSNSFATPSGEGIEVDLTYLDEYEHLNPTVLKIDVEGFEKKVLQGAKNILATRPKLAIEIHPGQLSRYGDSVQEFLDLLDLANYKMWIQWEDDQAPEKYEMGTPIALRAHLFCIPI